MCTRGRVGNSSRYEAHWLLLESYPPSQGGALIRTQRNTVGRWVLLFQLHSFRGRTAFRWDTGPSVAGQWHEMETGRI